MVDNLPVDPIPVVRLVPGVVQAGPANTLVVNVNGTTPPVWWPAGYIPTVGDAVKVLLVDGVAVVHSPVTTTQRPLVGTVSGTAASGVVPVTTSVGVLQCRYVGSPPANGTEVRLDWQSTTPWIWTGVTSTAPAPPPDGGGGGPTPPPSGGSGTLSVTALDSGTRGPYGWTTSTYGLNLTQGSYGGSTYTGGWFYGSAPAQLAGAAIVGARVRLGARRRMGNYNATLALQLYRTTNLTKPGGDTTRVEGPFPIGLVPNAPAQWVNIPLSYAAGIVAGGGLAIAGGDYLGVTGVGEDPASGQLQIDWRR